MTLHPDDGAGAGAGLLWRLARRHWGSSNIHLLPHQLLITDRTDRGPAAGVVVCRRLEPADRAPAEEAGIALAALAGAVIPVIPA